MCVCVWEFEGERAQRESTDSAEREKGREVSGESKRVSSRKRETEIETRGTENRGEPLGHTI